MRHALSGRSISCARILSLVLKTAAPAFVAWGLAGMTMPAAAQQFAALSTQVRTSEAYGPAKPIEAWTKFCARYAGECAVDIAEPETIELTAKIWTLITATNRKVNRRIKPTTDQQHWGVVDSWDLPSDGKGDCEDYQLLKRKLLVDNGLPRRAMRMAVVIDDEGQGHAVMMVRTSRGDVILDNKRDVVLKWEQTPYI